MHRRLLDINPGAETSTSPLAIRMQVQTFRTFRGPVARGPTDYRDWFLCALIETTYRVPDCESSELLQSPYSAESVQAAAKDVLAQLAAVTDAEAYYEKTIRRRGHLLDALASNTCRVWSVPGDAHPGAIAKVAPSADFAGPVTLLPDALRCGLPGQKAPNLWSSLLVRRDEALRILRTALGGQGGYAATSATGEPSSSRGVPIAPGKLRSEPSVERVRSALAFLEEKQREALAQYGKLLSRDALAQLCSKADLATTREVKQPGGLFQRLPAELRNPPRPSVTFSWRSGTSGARRLCL